MKNYVQPGNVITFVAAAVHKGGDFHEINNGFAGVVAADAAIGAEAELALVGVYNLKNPDSVVVAQGDLVGVDIALQKAVAAGTGAFDVRAVKAASGALAIPVMLPLGPGHAGL